MMQRTVIPAFFIVLLLSLNVYGQSNIDSLIDICNNKTIHDTIKIKLHGDIAWELMSSDINKALYHANRELELTTKLSRKEDIAQAESDIGNIYNRKMSYDTALLYYNKAVALRKELGHDIKVAGINSNIATLLIRQNKYTEALDISFQSLKIFEQAGDEARQCKTLINIGSIYLDMNQYNLAEQHFQKALLLAGKLKDPRSEGSALYQLGTIKHEIAVQNTPRNEKELDTVLHYYQRAEKLFSGGNDYFSLAAVYSSMGRVYSEKKELCPGTGLFRKDPANP